MQNRNQLTFKEIIQRIDEADLNLDLSNLYLADVIKSPDQLKQFCDALLRKKDQLLTLNLSNNHLGLLNQHFIPPYIYKGYKEDEFAINLIFKVLEKFSKLKYLNLRNINLLAGELSIKSEDENRELLIINYWEKIFSNVGKIITLEQLDLSGNNLDRAYSNIKPIYFQEIITKHFLKQLINLTNLRSFNLSGNECDMRSVNIPSGCNTYSWAWEKQNALLFFPALFNLLSHYKKLEQLYMHNLYFAHLEDFDKLFETIKSISLIELDIGNKNGHETLLPGSSHKTCRNRFIQYWSRIIQFIDKSQIKILNIANNGITADLGTILGRHSLPDYKREVFAKLLQIKKRNSPFSINFDNEGSELLKYVLSTRLTFREFINEMLSTRISNWRRFYYYNNPIAKDAPLPKNFQVNSLLIEYSKSKDIKNQESDPLYYTNTIQYLKELIDAVLEEFLMGIEFYISFGTITYKDSLEIITVLNKWQETIKLFVAQTNSQIMISKLGSLMGDIYFFPLENHLENESYEEANKVILEIPPSSSRFIEARSKMFEAMYIAYRNSDVSAVDAFKETYEYCLNENGNLIALTENVQRLFDSALLLARGKNESPAMHFSADQRSREFSAFKLEMQLSELYENRKKINYQNDSHLLFSKKTVTLEEIQAEKHQTYYQRKIVLIAREQTRISSLLNRVKLIQVDKAEDFPDYANQELSVYEGVQKQLKIIKPALIDSLQKISIQNNQVQQISNKIETLISEIQQDLIGNLGDNNYVSRFNAHQKVAKKIRDFQKDIENIYLNRKDEVYTEIHKKPTPRFA